MQSVMFDLDGTLVDTLEDLADSMNLVLSEMGFDTHAVPRYRNFVGDGMRTLVERVLPDTAQDETTIKECMTGMKRVYNERWNIKSRPYDGVPELLEELKGRGVVMSILSNKPDIYTQKVVDHYFDSSLFAEIRGALPEVPRKPDPAGAFRICESLNISPANWLYVGDTDTDMKTACSAGMIAVGVTWGFRSAEELTEFGAMELIDSPGELTKLLR